MNSSTPHCETFQEDLSLLAADCLSPEEAARVRAHLSVCSACRERLEQLQGVSAGLRAAGSGAEFDASKLMARVTAELSSATPISHKSVSSRLAWGVALAAVCAGLAISLAVGFSIGNRQIAKTKPPTGDLQHYDGGLIRMEYPDEIAFSNSPATWLELRNSFAQSDELFEAVLARDSRPLSAEPLNSAELLKESF